MVNGKWWLMLRAGGFFGSSGAAGKSEYKTIGVDPCKCPKALPISSIRGVLL
jgi:hypothetical protein